MADDLFLTSQKGTTMLFNGITTFSSFRFNSQFHFFTDLLHTYKHLGQNYNDFNNCYGLFFLFCQTRHSMLLYFIFVNTYTTAGLTLIIIIIIVITITMYEMTTIRDSHPQLASTLE